MMRYYIKGGPHSHGQHGYIVSNANWDPYPLANKIENFVIALGNMDIVVMLRIDRFHNTFFTGISARDALKDVQEGFWGYAPVDLQQEVQVLMNPVAPFGAAIVSTVEDLQAQTRLKVQRARHAVDTTFALLGFDLLQGSLWMDVRKAQDGAREFGPGPTAAWTAFRKVVSLPRRGGPPRPKSDPQAAADFVRTMPASSFYPTENLPVSTGSR
jgi:histidine ammonia-lyase